MQDFVLASRLLIALLEAIALMCVIPRFGSSTTCDCGSFVRRAQTQPMVSCQCERMRESKSKCNGAVRARMYVPCAMRIVSAFLNAVKMKLCRRSLPCG